MLSTMCGVFRAPAPQSAESFPASDFGKRSNRRTSSLRFQRVLVPSNGRCLAQRHQPCRVWLLSCFHDGADCAGPSLAGSQRAWQKPAGARHYKMQSGAPLEPPPLPRPVRCLSALGPRLAAALALAWRGGEARDGMVLWPRCVYNAGQEERQDACRVCRSSHYRGQARQHPNDLGRALAALTADHCERDA